MPEKLGAHRQMREYDQKDGQYLPNSKRKKLQNIKIKKHLRENCLSVLS
jgi:hypothetical protein